MATEFEIVRGTSGTLDAYLRDRSGNIIDLTGYTAISLYADKALNATSPALTKSVTAVTPTTGYVSFSFAVADTSSLPTGEYLAEIHATITGGVEYRTDQPFVFRIKQRVKL